MSEIIQSDVNHAFFVTMICVLAAGLFLPIVVGLCLPGRKGKMLTRREADWYGIGADEACTRLVERLVAERFIVSPGDGPHMLSALRKKEVQNRAHAIHTHESKPLNAEFSIEPHVAGVLVKATMWTPDLVFLDTGEGRHIDTVLNRLLSEEQNPPPPNVVPNVPYTATTSITTGGAILIALVILSVLRPDISRAFGVIHGLMLTGFVGVGLGIFGVRDTIVKPLEMKGRGLAIGGIVLSLAATAVAVLVFQAMYADAMPEAGFWKTLLESFPSRGKLSGF